MEELLTLPEVAEIMRTTRKTVSLMAENGKLPGAFRLPTGNRNSHWRIPRSAHQALRKAEG